jgi:hypothetical protein
VIFFLKFWWSNILAISLQISKNTLQFFLQFLISNFSFFLFFFFKNLPRLRVHPQLSHIGYPVDGVLVGAGSLGPKRVRETHSLALHTLGLSVSEELTTLSNRVGVWVEN